MNRSNGDGLAEFMTVASDLYRTDPAYRAEIDAERAGTIAEADPHWSTWDRLNEIQWLIKNGVEPHRACQQMNWEPLLAQTAARRWQHPVHAHLIPEVETAASETWAKAWLGARAA